MKLSTYTDYAYRILIYAGCAEERVTISQIAEAFGISKNHLRKVVHELSRLGYLETTQGRSGGMVLAREPGDVRLGDVARALENPVMVECFDSGTNQCPITGMCALKPMLAEARAVFYDSLNAHTLAEVIRNRQLKSFCLSS